MADTLNGLQSQEVASTDDGPVRLLRSKWRRRRKDSIVIPINNNESTPNINQGEISSNDTGEEATDLIDPQNSQSTTKSLCPIFSKTFQRYRIDLTSSSKVTESEQRRLRRVQRGSITKLVKPNSNTKVEDDVRGENSTPWGLMGGIFKGVMNQNARKSVESLYKEEINQGSFRWISCSAEDAKELPYRDEDFVAASAFFRMASDIISHDTTVIPQKNHYLALPETTNSVAQNLCDILNWYDDLLDKRTEVRAELDSSRSDAIPIVRFTVTPNIKNQQYHLERRRQRREVLPTSEDTERRTKAWVKRVLVKLGICPFTKSNIKSGQGLGDLGVPVANIMYRHSSALSEGSDVYLLMADAWEAISDMVAAGPSGKSGVSSILLSAPGMDDDFELWAGPVFAMLETCVGAIQAEEMVGVVCFHPQYVTPDGKSWPGFGQMHSVRRLKKWYYQHAAERQVAESRAAGDAPDGDDSSSSSSSPPIPPLFDNEIAAGGAWQRRTPHAVINVLRAEQLEAAEGRRSSGVLYERNIRVLVGKEDGSVGLEKLAEDLKWEQSL